MEYKKKGAPPDQLKANGRVVIGPGDVFKLCDDVQMLISSMK